MKKIIFSMVGSMLIGLCAVQAQQYDTAGSASNRTQQEKQRYEQSRSKRSDDRQSWNKQGDKVTEAYAKQGMVVIEKDEIPQELKETLKQEKYDGWEDATIFHNTNTGEYVIAPRAYRFDENGKEIKAGNLGYSSSDKEQKQYGKAKEQNQYGKAKEQKQYDKDKQQKQPKSEKSAVRDEDNTNQTSADRSNEVAEESANTTTAREARTQQAAGDRAADESSAADQTSSQQRDTEQASQRDTEQPSSWQRDSDQASADDATVTDQPADDASSQSQQSSNAYSNENTADRQQAGTQEPSTGYRATDETSDKEERPIGEYKNDQPTPGQYYDMEAYVEVRDSDIPASLRRTLSDEQFQGWEEKGTLYQHSSTDEYILIMDNQDNSDQAAQGQASQQRFHFDKEGNLKEDQSGTQRSESSEQ